MRVLTMREALTLYDLGMYGTLTFIDSNYDWCMRIRHTFHFKNGELIYRTR